MKLFKNQTFQIKVSKELEELEAEQNVKNSIILTKLFTIVGFQNILGFKLSQPNQHIHINIHALDPPVNCSCIQVYPQRMGFKKT